MKTTKMVSTAFCFFIISACFGFKANAQALNFSGEWQINLEHSDFGTLPKSTAAATYKIIQDEKFINIERTVIMNDSTIKSTEKINFDGSVTKTSLPNKIKESSIKWSSDKSELVETSLQSWQTKDGKNEAYQSIEFFMLSQDKKTLIYKRQVKSSTVNFIVDAIYDKI